MNIKTTIKNYLLEKHNIKDSKISPINGLGEANQVYEIQTDNNKYVLRINNADEIMIFQKEAWCHSHIENLGIDIPKIIDVSVYEYYAFSLLSFVDAKNSSQIKDEKLQNKIFHRLGEYAREIGTILPSDKIEGLGSVGQTNKWFYNDYLAYELEQTSKTNDYLILNTEDREMILNSIKLLSKTKFEFVLCHGDISLKNCMYNQSTDTLYLIDFGCAETNLKSYFEIMIKWLDLHYEKLINKSQFNSFVDGLIGDMSDSWLEKNTKIIEAYALVYALDKFRWSHDKNPINEKKYFHRLLSVIKIVGLNRVIQVTE